MEWRAKNGAFDLRPLVLGLVTAACRRLVITASGRRTSVRGGEQMSSSHWCRARPLFSELRNRVFVVDAVVEECGNPEVPYGMPFSLRLVSPGRDDYLLLRLRTLVAGGHPLSVTLEEGCHGRKAALSANGWMRTLDVEQTSGWPPPSRS